MIGAVLRRAVTRGTVGLVFAFGLQPLFAAAEANRKEAEEYSVKAAFLFNFAKFVDWPDSAFTGHPTAAHFCVLGTDPFAGSLERNLAGKTVGERRALVLHPKRLTDLGQCQLLFLAAGEAGRLPEVAAATAGQPVLLIGESPGFTRHGGMINFVLDQGFVRFEISPRNANAAGLRISSRLLDLARIADGGGR